jgi:uncharacterized membrane protein
MAELIAIGYLDMTTAAKAMAEAERWVDELNIEPEAIAAVIRDADGKFRVSTNHHSVGEGAAYGMFWELLFGVLFFVPFFGMSLGADLGALMDKVERSGIDEQFRRRVRDLMKPGTSGLFVAIEKINPDKVIHALGAYGGTVLRLSLAKGAEAELQDALHGKLPV